MFLARLWQSMPSAVSLGFLWGVMTLGVYLTYRILDFADLTVDGSFALGGAVLARLATIGMDPFLATLFSFCAGMLAGACTGLMHTKLKIPGLLASILTQIGLYSINLHIMGKANISLNTFVAGKRTTLTMFSQFPSFGMSDKTVILVYGGIIVAIVIALLWWFLNTEIGIAVRSTGDNERMSRALGINTNAMKLLCLMLSNGLVGLSGALIAQNNAVATLDMGTGGIVFGLAAVIIGEVIFRRKSLLGKLIAVILGSIVYRIIQSVVLILNWPPEDFKLLSAVIIAIALALPTLSEKLAPMLGKRADKAVKAAEEVPTSAAHSDAPDLAGAAEGAQPASSLSISGVSKTFNAGTVNQKLALAGVDLQLDPGDFVTIIGGNGAGKSTLLNSVAGVYTVDGGRIAIGDNAVTRTPEYKRAAFIGRVFQDPMMGTAANMTIEENLSIALRRGKRRTLAPAIRKGERGQYREALKSLDLGLENRLKTRVGLLSGGQRQALTLLMASLTRPRLLLLDEHTAALDPKTARNVLSLTQRIVQKYGLTAMMVTHNMKDALQYGNRTIMMHEGKVILDIDSKTKERLHVEDLLVMFEHASGDALNNDRMLLS